MKYFFFVINLNTILKDNGSSYFNGTSQVVDDDSVNFEIITRTSSDASGQYALKFLFDDYFNNGTLATATLLWNVTLNSPATLYTPNVIKKYSTKCIY